LPQTGNIAPASPPNYVTSGEAVPVGHNPVKPEEDEEYFNPETRKLQVFRGRQLHRGTSSVPTSSGRSGGGSLVVLVARDQPPLVASAQDQQLELELLLLQLAARVQLLFQMQANSFICK
jgi:hypothetical protein